MPCAASRRYRLRVFPAAKSRCRTCQLQRLDRSTAGGDRDRKDGRRPRHGAAMAQTAGAGVDVKISAGTHGGCMRVLTRANSGVDKLADLKGKIVAVGDLAGPDKNFFSIQFAKQGIDPNSEVDWRAYPGNLLQLAVDKGEAHAALVSDP